MKYLIYLHKRKDNNKTFYIGCSNNKKRPYDFIMRSNEWFDVYNKYGCYVEIYKSNLDKKYALNLEKELIIETENIVNKIHNGYESWNKNIKLSKKHKSKLKENSGQAKIVLDLTTGVFYNCIREASEIYGINYNSLRNRLNGYRKNKTNLILV